MENSSFGPDYCGGFTYTLVYESGPLSSAELRVYEIEPVSVNQHRIVGTLNDPIWFGRHVIRIRGINGRVRNRRDMREL